MDSSLCPWMGLRGRPHRSWEDLRHSPRGLACCDVETGVWVVIGLLAAGVVGAVVGRKLARVVDERRERLEARIAQRVVDELRRERALDECRRLARRIVDGVS